MKRSTTAILVASITIALGLGLMAARHQLLGVPLYPNTFTGLWDIELLVRSAPTGRSARLSLHTPTDRNLFAVTQRDFITDGYSLSALTLDGKELIIFSNTDPSEGEQIFSLRFRLKAGANQKPVSTKLNDKRDLLPPETREELRKLRKSLLARPKLEVVTEVLSDRRTIYPFLKNRTARILALQYIFQDGRELFGVPLVDEMKVSRFKRYFVFTVEEQPLAYQFSDGRILPLRKVFLWSESSGPIASRLGLSEPSWQLSATPVRALLARSRKIGDGYLGQALAWFSFERLSYGTQFGLRLLLLLPIASLIVAVLRNVVGLKTFGTFMPALLALSFRETGVIFGLAALGSIVAVGAFLRLIYKYLRLLFVPRMTASLCVVILVLCVGSLILHDSEIRPSSSLIIFPVIILTMVIERLSIALEEVGAREALRLSLYSIVAALLCYAAISVEWVSYIAITFPEVTLIILGLSILLGRYTGYRIFELFRFKDILSEPS